MRLLFVHERFGALGGAETNVLLTATEFKRRGHEVGVLHGTKTGKEEDAWSETFSAQFPLGGGSDAARAVVSAVRSFRPDVLFVHKLTELATLDALSTAGVPVVRMVHDHDLYCLRGYKYNPFNRKICTRAASAYCVFPCGGTLARNHQGSLPVKWVSYAAKRREIEINRRFTRLIVATEFMRGEVLRNGFAPEQVEIHAPVPRAAAETFHSSFNERNLIIYAGQIIRGKGVDVLLESLARVQVPFECLILGDGNHRAHCEELSAKLGLTNRVKFTGFVTQPEIINYYKEASLAVMSSLWPEPFGAVGLEAMRCGLPVVAFDAGGIREWLIDGWNGYLVPWMDRTRFATSVEELLRDKGLAQTMGAHGRQWVGERFGFPKYISGLEELFSRVAAPATVRPEAVPAGSSPVTSAAVAAIVS